MAIMWSEGPQEFVPWSVRVVRASWIREREGLVGEECVFEWGYPSSRCDCGLCSNK